MTVTEDVTAAQSQLLDPSNSYGLVLSEGCLTILCVPRYIGTRGQNPQTIERVQTGLRMEKRLLKVLKALAEFHDMTLGDLPEGVVLHALDGKCASQGESLARIRDLQKFYGLDLDSSASHKLVEGDKTRGPRKGK